ncbi:hypothetical protein ASG56_06060 [Rhodococcus sp. Leaf7]|nr:hypothetical protein ASG56_06060 [Rhodococcus sp. Leaf7]KQU42628.1 hypothetical protein ASG64_06060 [Rhodococcus sp. Leaf247]
MFASGSGAVNALVCVERRPGAIRGLVAHESPVVHSLTASTTPPRARTWWSPAAGTWPSSFA